MTTTRLFHPISIFHAARFSGRFPKFQDAALELGGDPVIMTPDPVHTWRGNLAIQMDLTRANKYKRAWDHYVMPRAEITNLSYAWIEADTSPGMIVNLDEAVREALFQKADELGVAPGIYAGNLLTTKLAELLAWEFGFE